MDIYNLKTINSLALEPEDKDDFDNWILQKDIVKYLEDESKDEYIIIYASLPHTFIHAVLIPDIEVNNEVVNDLLKWNYNPFSSWSLTCLYDKACIETPLSSSGSKTLKSGTQIIFGRSFEEKQNNKSYYEINQKISHILGVHYVYERQAWCKLDTHGDIEDIFKIFNLNSFPRNKICEIICVKKKVLGEYASVENLKLARMFDFTRHKSGSSDLGNNLNHSDLTNLSSIFGSLSVSPGTRSYSRGFQVLDIKICKEQAINSVWAGSHSDEKKQYCTYIANDFKNKITSEISCAPKCLANYFTKSDLPFEMTPAFFRPEVLSKYKSDRAKYQFNDRSVGCRSSWHLKTFDVNSAGQVHTYLIYLSSLPYEEQLHWKQYNEHPKTALSDRALKTDFEGQFYQEYEPLPSLKRELEKLHSEGVSWWKLRDQDALNKVQYPYTNSRDEWADEILHLDQLLVEGLEEKWLRNKAKKLKTNPNERLRALKLIEIILVAINFEEEHARKIMTPLHTVHNARSVLKGHTSGTEAEEIKKEALAVHGNFKKHFEKICSDCDESIKIIAKELKEL